MRLGVMAVLALAMGGCAGVGQDFWRGFRDEAFKQGLDTTREAIIDKLGDKVDGLDEKLDKLPPMPTTGDYGTAGGIGALLAYVLGSFGKGMVREKLLKKKDDHS